MLNRLVQRVVYSPLDSREERSDFNALLAKREQIPAGNPWRISGLFLNEIGQSEIENAGKMNEAVSRARESVEVDCIEFPASSKAAVHFGYNMMSALGAEMYIEAPVDGDQLTDVMSAIALHNGEGVFAKFRTGGPNPPTAEQTAHFMMLAALKGVGYKLTGRLHGLVAHTVTETGPDGQPHEIEESGYLNVVLAAEFARRAKVGTAAYQTIIDVLKEKDITAFEITDERIRYKGHDISTQDIINIRRTSLHSIGSCSFEEPVGELSKLSLAA